MNLSWRQFFFSEISTVNVMSQSVYTLPSCPLKNYVKLPLRCNSSILGKINSDEVLTMRQTFDNTITAVKHIPLF